MKLPQTITRFAGNVKLSTIKHAPEIFIASGVLSMAAATVIACKETIKAADIIDDFKSDKDAVKQVYEMHVNGEHMDDERVAAYDENEYKKEMLACHVQCAWKLFKCYAPAIALTTVGVTEILTGARILKKRELAAVATAAALHQSIDAYRERVAAKVGSEVENQLFHGSETKAIEVTEEDENGKSKKRKVRYQMPTCGSIYSRIFDASNDQYEKSGMQNFNFITGKLRLLNSKLVTDGHLFLNDVYDALDFPISVAGQKAGWIYNPDDPDNTLLKFVGINDLYFTDQGGIAIDYMTMDESWKALKNDWERDILIDFANIQDDILDDLPRTNPMITTV